MMFAIGIHYLTGRAVATHPANRDEPEWPPHPDRVFMALAAAFFETDEAPTEQAALEWLESLPAPAICASAAHNRDTLTSFVPVNDDASPLSKKQKPHMISGTFPVGRDRRPRTFPTVIPESDTVYLIWREAVLAEAHRPAVAALCHKVTYLGHSSSPVQMWVEEAPPMPNFIPTTGYASRRLRITGRGRLAALAASFQAGQRPAPSLWHGYAPPAPAVHPEPPIPHSVFDRTLIVFRRVAGQELPLETTLAITEAMRGLVMKSVPQPPPEWISGHTADGQRSEQDHLAFVPLPHVGRDHADGHLLGVALAVPRHIPTNDVARHLEPLMVEADTYEPRLTRLTLGRIGAWEILPEEREAPPLALDPNTWTRPAQCWATVTPIVLDRYPKRNHATEAEQAIGDACERIGLPRPVNVVTTPVSLFIGVPHASNFAPMPAKSGARRWHTHAVLSFAEPVSGPVLLGAGRYRGYGLCRPYWGRQGDGA